MKPFTSRDLRLITIGTLFGFTCCFVGYSFPAMYLVKQVVYQEKEIRDLNATLDKELPWFKRIPGKGIVYDEQVLNRHMERERNR